LALEDAVLDVAVIILQGTQCEGNPILRLQRYL